MGSHPPGPPSPSPAMSCAHSRPFRALRLSCALACAALLSACGDAPSEPRATGSPSAAEPETAEAPEPAGAPTGTPEGRPQAAPSPTPVPEPVAAGSKGPGIRFDERIHAFGKRSDVESLEHAFEFVNTGDQRLVVNEIRASCGCTATSLDKKVFEPGERDSIAVDWHPKGSGSQRKSITVHSNSRDTPLAVLYVEAEIEPFVRVEPVLVRFGRVRLGEQHIQRAKLSCDDPDLLVESVTSRNPHFACQVVTGEDGGRELEVVLRPTAPWGQNFTSIQIAVLGRPTPEAVPVQHEMSVSVNARVFSDIETDMGMFGVGRIDPGASFRYEVKVLRESDEPFAIVDTHVAQSIPPGMSVRSEPLAEGEGNGYRLVLEGETGDYIGTIRGQVRFTTDVAGEGERTLSVMGIVRALDAVGK